MQIEFHDDKLHRLYVDVGFRDRRYESPVVKSCRKKVSLIQAATDLNDLKAMRSLHLEKLKGNREDQYSIRLNDKWRLILKLREEPSGQTVVIVEIVDYH